MSKKLVKTEIDVIDNKIGIMRIGNVDYISLTDLARYADAEEPRLPIRDWMRNKEVISYLGLWESMNNKNFKGGEFATFKNEAGSNKFKMSPQKWIKETNAIGIVSKSGRYDGGTFAHPDIAFEFASWLSPEFKLYLIKEYVVHTDAVKNYIVPTLTEEQKRFVYAEEADVLNVALFGMTAKEWREKNPELAKKGNMRDYTDLLHLVILNNLENTNAEFIKLGISQSERLINLNNSARNQMEILKNNNNIKELELLQERVNENNKVLIENK